MQSRSKTGFAGCLIARRCTRYDMANIIETCSRLTNVLLHQPRRRRHDFVRGYILHMVVPTPTHIILLKMGLCLRSHTLEAYRQQSVVMPM